MSDDKRKYVPEFYPNNSVSIADQFRDEFRRLFGAVSGMLPQAPKDDPSIGGPAPGMPTSFAEWLRGILGQENATVLAENGIFPQTLHDARDPRRSQEYNRLLNVAGMWVQRPTREIAPGSVAEELNRYPNSKWDRQHPYVPGMEWGMLGPVITPQHNATPYVKRYDPREDYGRQGP